MKSSPRYFLQRRNTKTPLESHFLGLRSIQIPLDQETSLCSPSEVEMGPHQCKSTSPESSSPPIPRPEHCNGDKAEENDLKNSLKKMLEEAFEGKIKNISEEIEEKTNKKMEEINKEIEEKNKKLE
ncbi:hypothetical protein STEG23_013003 [Scotinomys teguina]